MRFCDAQTLLFTCFLLSLLHFPGFIRLHGVKLLSPFPRPLDHRSTPPHPCSVTFPSPTPFGRRKGAHDYTLLTSKSHLVVSRRGTVSDVLKATYGTGICRAQRKDRPGMEELSVLRVHASRVQRHKVCELWKTLRTAWSTCPGGRHPRAKRSHVPRLQFSFTRLETRWGGGGAKL